MRKSKRLSLRGMVLLTAALLTGGLVHGQIVSQYYDDGSGNSPGTLSYEINAASPGDNIELAVSSITLSGTVTINKSLTFTHNWINSYCTIIGNPGGGLTFLPMDVNASGSNVAFNRVIFQGGIHKDPSLAQGGFFKNNSNLTFNDCQFLSNMALATGASGQSQGGAVYSTGPLTFNNCLLNNNSLQEDGTSKSIGKGGAIYIEGAALTCQNSVFELNDVRVAKDAAGGSIYATGTTLVDECVFTGGDAVSYDTYGVTTGYSGHGGAIAYAGSSLTVSNSSFSYNSAISQNASGSISTGGAISDYVGAGAGTVTITGCTFDQNHTRSYNSEAYGGAVDVEKKSLNISQSTFTNNYAETNKTLAAGGALTSKYMVGSELIVRNNTAKFVGSATTRLVYGGGIYIKTGTLNLTQSEISGNLCTADAGTLLGGGIYAKGTNLSMENNTVSGNTVQAGSSGSSSTTACTLRGGGVYLHPTSTFRVMHNTVILNTLTGYSNSGSNNYRQGSGLFFGVLPSGSKVLQNNLITQNATVNGNGGNSDAHVFSGTLASTGGNLKGTWTGITAAGSDVTNAVAGVFALAANGGYGKTHALICNAPARNIGLSINSPQAFDQRGEVRPYGGGVHDAGAYEAKDLASLTVNAPASVCVGECMLVEASDPTFANYEWQMFSSGIPVTFQNGTDASFCMTLSQNSDFRLVVTDGLGCTRVIDFSVAYATRCTVATGACCLSQNKMLEIAETPAPAPQSLTLAPNPTNGWVKVMATLPVAEEAASISVVDMTGKVVYQTQSEIMGEGVETSLDLSTLPAGMYFLRLQSGKEVMTQRLAIER